ncbi:hypothetical protein AB0A66_21995 [Streptomyces longwoodensis]|uniref:hypothetical protein n=1 Tax=Streptomyces longwoodensis TaxID=68231 RepID=UPI003407211D
MGLSSAFSCVADHAYVCVSFRIWAAASSRTRSSCAAGAAASGVDAVAVSEEFDARPPPPVSRGIDAWACAIAPDASVSHFAASSLKSPSRSVELARSALHVRNAFAPSPFHATHCGRTFSSSAIPRIAFAAAVRRPAAACTWPASARSSQASI